MDSGIIVWFICLIPVITTVVFYVMKSHEFVWWELIVPVVATIAITFITKLITDEINVKHDEVWGSTVIEIYESEPWNEWVHKTCTRSYPCGSDSKGNTKYCTETYDCSYQDDHGPRWYGKTDIGETAGLRENQYDSILRLWGSTRSVSRTHNNHSSSSRSVSSGGTKFAGTRVGRKSYVYQSNWTRQELTRIPYSSRHTYENRIQASDVTVFDIKVVTPAEADSMNLFEYVYPKGNGVDFPTILSQVPISDSVRKEFRKLNAKFGPSNRVRLWVLVYDNANPTIGHYQENYWVKGNFNEFVICISVGKNNKIQWSHAFSWTLTSELPVATRSMIIGLKTLNKEGWRTLHYWLNNNLKSYEKRSHDEFEYIKVTPPTWAIILNVILSTIVALGFNFWVANNDTYDSNHSKNKNRGYRGYRRY